MIGWWNRCGARRNWKGSGELTNVWQVIDFARRKTCVDLKVCLALHEVMHVVEIDEVYDDADIIV